MLAAAVVAGLVTPSSMAAPAGEAAEGSAAATAKRLGHRVEIAARTTADSQTFANPDGTTTVELSAVPVRARRGVSWVPLDMTLRRAADGSVTPTVAAVDTVFSGGGRSPLATVRRGSAALTMGWPDALPEPVLDADTATYRDVLPDVDLKVRATAGGFTEVLVVKTPRAATHPRLRKVAFDLKAAGGTVRPSAGGFALTDAAGTDLFISPQPLMWDSSGAATDRAKGPGDGAVRSMNVDLAPGSLGVVPDQEALVGKGMIFPLYIDPTVEWVDQTRRAMVDRTYPNTSNDGWVGDVNNAEGSGYMDDPDEPDVHLKRLFFAFDVSRFKYKTITSATFKAYETWADNCTKTDVQLIQTTSFGAGVTWNNQPSYVRQLDHKLAAAGRTSCWPAGQWVEFNATAGISEAAVNAWSLFHFRLSAADESTNAGWKRFKNNTQLSVTYNTPPAAPTALGLASPVAACVFGAARPVIPQVKVKMKARLNDLDGENVQATFDLWGAGGVHIAGYPVPTAYKASGTDFVHETTTTLPAGTYGWRVKSTDGTDTTDWSPWCEFTIDADKPKTPEIVPLQETYTVKVGARFEFTNGGSTDVVKYKWGWSNEPTSTDVPASSPIVEIAPPTTGPNTLYLWSYDAANNRSEPTSLPLDVRGANGTSCWQLDEGAGTTTADGLPATPDNPSDPITLTGAPAWIDGPFGLGDPTDKALRFNGVDQGGFTNGTPTASSAVVDTKANFTVSAWVKVAADTTGRRIAISQNGAGGGNAFALGVNNGLFSFTVQNPASPADEREVTAPIAGNDRWIHLAGVYESTGSRQLTLYVNGTATDIDEALFAPAAKVAPTRLARGVTAGVTSSFWRGDIEDVRTFAGALDAGNAFALAAEYRVGCVEYV